MAKRLSELRSFEHPRIDLEQYSTPPEIAAHVAHVMGRFDDVTGHVVVDLGAGTGSLSLAVALAGPDRVIGIERDPSALATAVENERTVRPSVGIEWIVGDVARLPICTDGTTVISNPPFGAQRSNVHADRAFLAAAETIGRVSYTFHNAGSREFVEAFTEDHGGSVTHGWSVTFDLERQFDFHRHEITPIEAELYRIQWG